MNIKVWLAYVLSLIISFVVVIHSYNYLSLFFNENVFLLISVIGVIEISFISLPYIASMNVDKKVWWDGLLIGLLFFLSVIPATLQTTDGFTKQMTEQISSAPLSPQQSSFLGAYKKELSEINDQLVANNELAKTFASKKFITKAERLLDMNERHVKRKGVLLQKVTELEQAHQKKLNVHAIELRRYNVIEQKESYNSFFDFLKIIWSLLLIAILQLVNGRFIFHGTRLMQLVKQEEKELSDINTTEFMTTNELLSMYSVTGLGEVTTKSFIEKYNISTHESLLGFVDTDFETSLKDSFSNQKSKILIRLCKQIIKRNQSTEGTE